MTETLTPDERRVRLEAEARMLHDAVQHGTRNITVGASVFAALGLYTAAWLIWLAHQPLSYLLPMIPVSAVGVMFIFSGSQGRSFARLQMHITSAHLEYLQELVRLQGQVDELHAQRRRDREETARQLAEYKSRMDLLEARITHPRARKWARYGWTAPRQATASDPTDEAAYLVDMSEAIRIGRELERRQSGRRGEPV